MRHIERNMNKPTVRYYSTQINSHFTDGVGQTKENTVEINGAKAVKSTTLYNAKGRVIRRKTMKLKPEERKAILGNVFIPDLFKKCIKAVKTSKRTKINK